jgi:phosphate acetyltransferase
MKLLEEIRSQAKKCQKTIVLPEAHDERIVLAAEILEKKNIARIILIGDPEKINRLGAEHGADLTTVKILNPAQFDRIEEFNVTYFEKRKHKGMTDTEARKIMQNPTFFGAMLVEKGLADGCVSGADTTTGDVLKAALHIIGVNPVTPTVSSDIIMITADEQKIWSFADCRCDAQSDRRTAGRYRPCHRRDPPQSRQDRTDRCDAVFFNQGQRQT